MERGEEGIFGKIGRISPVTSENEVFGMTTTQWISNIHFSTPSISINVILLDT